MQNWNQWQLSAGAVATPMPQPPVGYATAGADPMAMMQSYMQYFSQPAPSGYTAEQWTAAQQQNWAQWQQWQQQYQQWQAQYGEKYQETMKHMSAQNMNLANQVPQVSIVQPPPPLPKEDSKPPLPPSTLNAYQFTSMPPPHQNNLPLFPAKQNTTGHSSAQNPPLPPTQPPLPPDSSSSISKENNLSGKRGSSTASESTSAKKLKVEDEELTEAEKTFDAQFKQWEEQFNKWKEQNANHPDKTQYKQYEAKWTSWREKLIERREQMRRKREQQKQAAAKAEVEKNKSLPGDDKIMNILSSTENQGLINNLLGIGKSLGLTGKQNSNVPPPPPPPPPATQVASPSVQTATITSSSQATSQSSTSQMPGMSMMSPSTWSSQQWTPQYNAGVNVSNYSNYQPMTGVPPPSFNAPQTQMSAPNFTQPPPSFSNVPNFSHPPPGFSGNDSRQNCNLRSQAASSMQGRPPALASNNGNGPDESLLHNERSSQAGPMNSFESNRQKDGLSSDRIGRDNMNDQPGNQFRPTDAFGQRNESYKLNDDRAPESEQFRREDRSYQEHGSNNQFSSQKLNFSNDRFSLGPFAPSNNRFAPSSDRFGMGNDRPVLGNDRFGPGSNKFGNDRFAPGGDRIGQGNEPANDRFGPNNDRFSSNNEPFGPGSLTRDGDRFNRSSLDRFESKDTADRRDSFPNAARSFARNDQFKPPDKFAPELKKLMEKRRVALDVFRPSYLDSDKSCNVGSLSESFKKITGESPFMKSSPGNNFGPRGPPNFGPVGCGNFRMSGDFKPPGNPEFGPRCPMGMVRNNSFDSRDGGIAPFRGPNSSPQLMPDFMSAEPRSEIGNIGHNEDMNKGNIAKPLGVAEQVEVIDLISNEQINSAQKDCPEIYPAQNDSILLLEKPLNWGDGQFPQDNSPRNDANSSKVEESLPANYNPPELGTQDVIGETAEKRDLSNNDTSGSNKEAEVLPFMGENDPKPEDLNMEPPPELPNLGPVSIDNNESSDPSRRMNEPYDAKDPSSKPFPNNPESFDPREAFDTTLGPRGMQFRPNAPFPGPRGPNDRLPVSEPRGPSTFNSPGQGPPPLIPPRIPSDEHFGLRGPNNIPFGPRGPTDGQFGPRGPTDGQFGPRGPTDGQFGPRGPTDGQFGPRGPTDGQFGPKGPTDGQFGPRGPTDGQFGPRGPTDGQFGPRGPTDGQFGPKGPTDGQFGPKGPTDGQFGPKGPTDGQFGPKGPIDGQFGPKGPIDGQFGPRGNTDGQLGPRGNTDEQLGPRGNTDGQLGPRGNTDGQLGPRGNTDEQLGPRGPSDAQFGPRGVNERLFAPRAPTDVPFGPRGSSEGPFAPRGPNEGPFAPRGPNEGPFAPRGPNEGPFAPRGPKEGPFAPRGPNEGPFAPRGPNEGPFAPRGSNEGPFAPRGSNEGPFAPRGPNEGPFAPRGSNEGPFAPRGPNEGPFAPRGPNDGPFGSRAPIDGPFVPRGSMDNKFGSRGQIDNQFGPRGPNTGQFGIRGSSIGQFVSRYDEPFAPRRLNEGQFGPRGLSDGQFGSQGPNSRQFGPGRPNDPPFDNRGLSETQLGSRGPNEGQLKFPGSTDRPFEPRRNEGPFQRSLSGSTAANPDGQFPNRYNERQFDAPADGSFASQKGGSADAFFGPRPPVGGLSDAPFAPRVHPDRPFDTRGLGDFRPRGQVDACPKPRETSEPGGSDVRGDGGAFEANDRIQIEPKAQQGQFDSNEKQKPGWRPPFPKSNFTDLDQRPAQDFRYAEKPLPPQSDAFNQGAANNLGRRSPPNPAKYILPDKRSKKAMPDLAVGDYKARYGESSSGSDYSKFNSPNVYMKRPIDNRQSQARCSTVKEFCIEKQFNYNHGGATAEKKFVEHIPAKVIDYAHTSRTSIQDHLTPVQCFDYGHGNLKPLVPEHEPPPKTDFRNWEESEQNLKEYTDKIKTYEHYSERVDSKRSGAYNQRRNSEELIDDKRPERDRREKAYKGKEREDKVFDRVAEKDQEHRYDKNAHKERTREKFESSQKEANKESTKDEDRSKGNINWQENSSKSIVETKPLDTSVTDTQHNVVESAPKTLELAKTPNCTMVDDLLCPPGRQNRPPKIAIILRGPPGSGKSFVAKLIKDKEVEQGGSAPRILSLDDYFLVEKEIDSTDDNGKKIIVKEMAYEYEEAMEQSYVTSLVKAFKKNITDGFFNFIILDCINEKISDYEEMWSFAKTKGFKVYVCEMEMDVQICLKRNIHNRTEDEINRIIDYFEPTPSYHQKLDVNSMLQEQAIEEVHMEDSEETQEKSPQQNEDSQDSQEDILDSIGVSKWERMEAEDKLDRLDGLAKKKNEGKVQTMQDFLQVPDYYNMEDTSGKKRVRWADLEERKEQEKMRAVGFVVGHTNWDRMMDPTKGGSALTRTKWNSCIILRRQVKWVKRRKRE